MSIEDIANDLRSVVQPRCRDCIPAGEAALRLATEVEDGRSDGSKTVRWFAAVVDNACMGERDGQCQFKGNPELLIADDIVGQVQKSRLFDNY